MKKSNLILLTALIVAVIIMIAGMITMRSMLFASYTHGDGSMTQSERQIPAFEKIKINGKYNVYYTQSDNKMLVVHADANLMEFISTEVKNNELRIRSSQPLKSDSELRIELSNDYITHVEASASAKFFAENALLLPILTLTSNAGAEMDVEGIFESLYIYQNAGSKVTVRGETDLLHIESNAGGHVDATRLEAGSANVQANAGASASVNAAEIEASANAGGSVRYIGDPVFNGISTSAGGSISKSN